MVGLSQETIINLSEAFEHQDVNTLRTISGALHFADKFELFGLFDENQRSTSTYEVKDFFVDLFVELKHEDQVQIIEQQQESLSRLIFEQIFNIIENNHNLEKIEKILYGIPLDLRTRVLEYSTTYSVTLLISAAAKGHLDIVNLLLACGEDIDQRTDSGDSALQWAVQNEHIEVVKFLIAHGANITQVNNLGYNPLIIAVKKNLIEIVNLLITNGTDIDQVTAEGDTALLWAIDAGHLEIARILIALGANINQANKLGYSPLIIAVKSGHLEIIKLLLASGADINQFTAEGDTALLWAIEAGHLEIAKILIAHGANINLANNNGCSPLILAVEKGHFEIINLLLASGADINQITTEGNTALLKAIQNGQNEISKILIGLGANTNIENHSGYTPIQLAASSGQIDIVKALIPLLQPEITMHILRFNKVFLSEHLDQKNEEMLKALFNTNTIKEAAQQILWYACENNDVDLIVKINELLEGNPEKTAVFNLTDEQGCTPLMNAASKSYLDIVAQLLVAGADPCMRNSQGQTALLIANSSGYPDALQCVTTINLVLKNLLVLAVKEKNQNEIERLINAEANIIDAIAYTITGNDIDSFNILLEKLSADKVAALIDAQSDIGLIRVCAIESKNEQIINKLNKTESLIESAKKNIWFACYNHEPYLISIIHELIEAHPEKNSVFNMLDDQGRTPLIYAAEKSDFQMLLKLFEAGADPTIKDAQGRSILEICTSSNDTNAIKCEKIIRQRLSSLLGIAAKAKNKNEMERFIQEGANLIDTIAEEISNGDMDSMNALIELLPAYEASTLLDKITSKGVSIRINALESANEEIINTLHHTHSIIDAAKQSFWQGCHNSDLFLIEAVVTLLDSNPQQSVIFEMKDDQERTPLMYAAEKNDLITVKRLLTLGADPTTENAKGQSAILIANNSGYSAECTAEIKKSLNLKLSDAVYKKDESEKNRLITLGANFNSTIERIIKNSDANFLREVLGSLSDAAMSQIDFNKFFMLAVEISHREIIMTIFDFLSDEQKLEVLTFENDQGITAHLVALNSTDPEIANIIEKLIIKVRETQSQKQTTQVPIIFHDVVAYGANNATGEYSNKFDFASENAPSIENPVPRLYDALVALINQATTQHEEKHFEFNNMKDGHENDVTRLITSEFSFYTQKPLYLTEFQTLMQDILNLASKKPENLHLILSSFSVQSQHKPPYVANVVAYIECGPKPNIRFVTKNYHSSIDPIHEAQDPSSKSRKLLDFYDCFIDPTKRKSLSFPQIKLNGVLYDIFNSFSNTFLTRTKGGQSSLLSIEICLDHKYKCADVHATELLNNGHKSQLLPTRGSLIISSNTINFGYSTGTTTHADRYWSSHNYFASATSYIQTALGFFTLKSIPPRFCANLKEKYRLMSEKHNARVMTQINLTRKLPITHLKPKATLHENITMSEASKIPISILINAMQSPLVTDKFNQIQNPNSYESQQINVLRNGMRKIEKSANNPFELTTVLNEFQKTLQQIVLKQHGVNKVLISIVNDLQEILDTNVKGIKPRV